MIKSYFDCFHDESIKPSLGIAGEFPLFKPLSLAEIYPLFFKLEFEKMKKKEMFVINKEIKVCTGGRWKRIFILADFVKLKVP